MNDSRVDNPDLLMLTFDALRYDVAAAALAAGKTPLLASLVPHGWERRHSPATFTYAAHAAFFAGFWPTPVDSGEADARPFALRFHGRRALAPETAVLDGPDIVAGLKQRGYRTVCIGGVGFFNKLNPLGSVLPALFEESFWKPQFGVAEVHSTRAQVRQAAAIVTDSAPGRPLFLFINISATHPPTHIYSAGAAADTVQTQTAALEYVDRELPPLFESLRRRGRPGRVFLMSDHGTLFGEDGRFGHRTAHPDVWTVPYAEYVWEAN